MVQRRNVKHASSVVRAVWVLACCAAAGVAGAGEAPISLGIHDEVVCRVNTEAISKLQVEDQMGMIAVKLYAQKRALEEGGRWNDEASKVWDELYLEPFREALREVIRDRLLLQHAKEAKVPFDEVNFNRRVKEAIEQVRRDGMLNKPGGLTIGEIQKRMREKMLISTYRDQNIYNFLDNPNRPEVHKFYQDNINRYQRKAGMLVYLIRVDRFVTNKLTGATTLREDALEQAERLREDIVKYKADFEEVARQHSDDADSRPRGGLIQLDPKDPYIDPESYNPALAKVLRALKKGEISKVVELNKNAYGFVWVKDIREAGPAPLEGQLYDEIYQTLMRNKNRKNEDEWFRKALKRALIVHVVKGREEELPMEFFFPPEQKDTLSAGNKP